MRREKERTSHPAGEGSWSGARQSGKSVTAMVVLEEEEEEEKRKGRRDGAKRGCRLVRKAGSVAGCWVESSDPV